METVAERRLRSIYWIAVCASLIPLAVFQFLPLNDGNSHVYISKMLVDYARGSQLAREYFVLNPTIPPNWIDYALMFLAMHVVSPTVAEKLVWFGYVLGFLLSFRYSIRSVSASGSSLEYLAFPLVYNVQFHWGFYNFCFSLVFYLLSLGAYLRFTRRETWPRRLGLSCLALLAYLSHLVGFGEFVVALGLLELFRWWNDGRTKAQTLRGMVNLAVILGPSFLLLVRYLTGKLPIGPNHIEWPTFHYAFSTLFTLAPLGSFRPVERLAGLAVAGIIVLLTAWAIRESLRRRFPPGQYGLLAVAVVAMLLPFLSPASFSDATMITARLVYFPLFALALFAAPLALPQALRLAVPLVSLAVAAFLAAIHVPLYAGYDRQMKVGLALAPHLQPQHTFLFVPVDASESTLTLVPETGLPSVCGIEGYLAAGRDLIDLGNYEAETPHFPLIYRALVNSSSDRSRSRCAALAGKAPTGDPEYVVAWSPRPAALAQFGVQLGPCGYRNSGISSADGQFLLFESQAVTGFHQ